MVLSHDFPDDTPTEVMLLALDGVLWNHEFINDVPNVKIEYDLGDGWSRYW